MSQPQTPPHPATFIVSPIINVLKREANRPLVQMAGGAAWTGRDLLNSISQFTQALIHRGASNGARVALLASNSIEVLILHNATSFSGACLVALHPMGSVDDHLFAIEDAGVETLIYDPKKFGARASEIVRRTNRIKTVLSLGDGETGDNLLKIASQFKPAPLVPPVMTGTEITRLSYSGGTTGKPKAIPWKCARGCAGAADHAERMGVAYGASRTGSCST